MNALTDDDSKVSERASCETFMVDFYTLDISDEEFYLNFSSFTKTNDITRFLLLSYIKSVDVYLSLSQPYLAGKFSFPLSCSLLSLSSCMTSER